MNWARLYALWQGKQYLLLCMARFKNEIMSKVSESRLQKWFSGNTVYFEMVLGDFMLFKFFFPETTWKKINFKLLRG